MAKSFGVWALGAALAASAGQPCRADAPAPAAATPAATTGLPPRIPTSAFAAQSLIRGPLLSPDGLHFIARRTQNGVDMLLIFDLTGKEKPIALGEQKDTDINWYKWAGNGTILIGIGKTVPWFDDEAYLTRLVSYDLTTKSYKFISKNVAGRSGDDVLWVDPQGKSILMAYQESVYQYPSVYSVDLATNRSSKAVDAQDDIWDWWADTDGVVRFGFGYYDEHKWKAVYRKSAADHFVVVAKGRDDKDDGAWYDAARIVVGSDNGMVSSKDEKTGLTALYNFNFATRKKGDVIFEAPANDIDDYDTTEDGKSLRAVWYTDDHPRVKWWDGEMKSFQDNLDKAVNGGDASGDRMARVLSQSRDHGIKIVWVGASNDPGSYYLYQDSTGKMTRLAKLHEELDPSQLAKPTYLHYKSRDGLDIPAYLTLPVGRAAKKLPLIIMPHGGPFDVRDDGTFDQDAQFLANRGYAVLQPQYRGSGTYGKAFYEKGKGQYGRGMQDDIDDGMDWLASQGIIDPKRACIVGISYGGYAALWGGARNPERYRCAASLAGVTDIGRQIKYDYASVLNNRHDRDDWHKTVQGDKDFDLKTISPLFTVDRLTVPVLVMHGDKDQRVLPKQSRLYAEALKAAGKTYEYTVLPGNGHGYTTTAGAQIWYDRLDAFLAKYNPAD